MCALVTGVQTCCSSDLAAPGKDELAEHIDEQQDAGRFQRRAPGQVAVEQHPDQRGNRYEEMQVAQTGDPKALVLGELFGKGLVGGRVQDRKSTRLNSSH